MENTMVLNETINSTNHGFDAAPRTAMFTPNNSSPDECPTDFNPTDCDPMLSLMPLGGDCTDGQTGNLPFLFFDDDDMDEDDMSDDESFDDMDDDFEDDFDDDDDDFEDEEYDYEDEDEDFDYEEDVDYDDFDE